MICNRERRRNIDRCTRKTKMMWKIKRKRKNYTRKTEIMWMSERKKKTKVKRLRRANRRQKLTKNTPTP